MLRVASDEFEMPWRRCHLFAIVRPGFIINPHVCFFGTSQHAGTETPTNAGGYFSNLNANFGNPASYPQSGTIGETQNTPNDYLTKAISSVLLKTGIMNDEHATYRQAQKFADLLNLTPLGIPQAGYDAGQIMGSGYATGSKAQMGAGTVAAALTALPGIRSETPEIAQAVKEGITAFHGSPHLFDKFDASNMGGGEGSKAFGHGLYFAEHPDVAKLYRDNLSEKTYSTSNGVTNLYSAMADLAKAARSTGPMRFSDSANIADAIMEGIDGAGSISKFKIPPKMLSGEQAPAYQAALQKAREMNLATNSGHIYQVNIAAHPDQFLDFDKAYKDQHPGVQQAIDNLLPTKSGTLANNNGEAIHAAISDNYGGSKEAASALSSQGVPGIKYLDKLSRGADKGTRNYVVFNPNHVQIVKRYAIPAAAVGTGAATALNTEQQQE